MAHSQDPEVKQLIKIERRLTEIKDRTANTKRAFFYGLLQGAGAVIGSIVALMLLGWFLSVLGVIPGFGDITEYLRSVVTSWRAR